MKFFEDLFGITKLRQEIELKQSATDALIVGATYGNPPKTWEKYSDYVKEAYFRNSTVGDCLEYIAKAIGGIDWFSIKKDSTGKEAEVGNSKLIDLIYKPNPFVNNKTEFFRELILYLYLSGNEYMQRAPLDSKEVRELYNLRPDRMSIIKGTGMERIAGYKYSLSDMESGTNFKLEDILHMKFFNPLDDWYGISPLKRIEFEIDQTNEAQLWNYNLLRNGGVPQAILLFKKILTEENKRAIQTSFKEKFGGAKNAGKIGVLDNVGEVDIKTLGFSPLAMNWLEGLYFTKAQIAVSLGVPPELVGDTKHKIFNNYKEARKSFYEDTVLPFMDWLQGNLNSFLTSYFNGEELRYDKDDIEALSEDRTSKYNDAVNGYNAGLLQKNEARDLMQQPAIEGEDSFKPAPSGFGTLSINTKLEKKTLAGLDINTDELKDIYWKSREIEREQWIEEMKKKILVRLEEEKNEIAKSVMDGKPPEDGINEDKWYKTLLDIYVMIGMRAAEAEVQKLKSMYNIENKAGPTIAFGGMSSKKIISYFDKVGMKKVRYIKNTVKSICKSELKEGMDLGESPAQLASRIKDKIENIIPNRATVIARTEVVGAGNAGDYYGAMDSGLNLEKHWLTVRDGKEREWHSSVDGQVRDMDEPFDVPNRDGVIEQLMFPLDSSLGASADNIIQCRCVMTYSKKV